MLLLDRHKDEKITIDAGGHHIRITVVEICGDRVRLGIEAPLEVPVHRLEIYEAIQKNAAPGQNEGPRDD